MAQTEPVKQEAKEKRAQEEIPPHPFEGDAPIKKSVNGGENSGLEKTPRTG